MVASPAVHARVDRRRRRPRSRAWVAGFAFLAVLGGNQPAAAAPVVYERPVPGPVVEPFRAPDTPYGTGHRGVDLAAAPGEPVRVAAGGTVAFAGAVAGAAWVSVDHPDGLRTTYGPLADVVVVAGQALRRGDVLGAAVQGHRDDGQVVVHWGARRLGGAGGPRAAERYLDPMTLLGRADPVWVPTLVGPGAWEATDEPEVPGYASWDGSAPCLRRGSPVAAAPGWVLPPNPNHVVGVAGFGSATGKLPVDLTHLGYRPDDLTYLSYAGREDTAAADQADPGRDQAPYGPLDTLAGVHAAAERLAEQLRAQWARSPGQAVDLVGHSMGGVVVLYYTLFLHDPADPTLPPVAHVATLGSPLDGADLARAVRDAQRNPAAAAVLRLLGTLVPRLDPDATAISDLAVGSELLEGLAERWTRAVEDPWRSPLATGTRVVTFGGSRDLVVPERRSSLPDADHVVLPGGHDRMRLTEASRIALRAFLAGQPVPGRAGGACHVLSYPIGWAQRGLGVVVGRRGVVP